MACYSLLFIFTWVDEEDGLLIGCYLGVMYLRVWFHHVLTGVTTTTLLREPWTNYTTAISLKTASLTAGLCLYYKSSECLWFLKIGCICVHLGYLLFCDPQSISYVIPWTSLSIANCVPALLGGYSVSWCLLHVLGATMALWALQLAVGLWVCATVPNSLELLEKFHSQICWQTYFACWWSKGYPLCRRCKYPWYSDLKKKGRQLQTQISVGLTRSVVL